MITREKFEEIFDNTKSDWTGDNCFKGLQIISKYIDNPVQGAGHDEVWSEDVDVLIEAGITEDDIISLAKLNWVISEDYLCCYV